MRRPRRQQSEPQQAIAWMTTYSDLVTLLLAFFVLLFSFSSIDLRKLEDALFSIQGALGILQEGRSLVPSDILTDPNPPHINRESVIFVPDLAQMRQVERQVHEALLATGFEDAVVVHVDDPGLLVRFKDSILFDSGQAYLRREGAAVLERLIPVFRDIPNRIRVEGHTDNRPIYTVRYPSNWELSTARAGAVIRFLIDRGKLDPRRLEAAGYSEYRPIADNADAEGRRQNRRVDLVILFQGEMRGLDDQNREVFRP